MQGSDMAVSLVPEEGGVGPLPSTATRFHFPFGLAHKKKEEKEEEKKGSASSSKNPPSKIMSALDSLTIKSGEWHDGKHRKAIPLVVVR